MDLLLPPLVFTKIWMLSAGKEEADIEEVSEDDRERMVKKKEESGVDDEGEVSRGD